MDSSQFDIRLMSSSAITLNTPRELGKGLAPYIDDIIMSLPKDDETIELRIRSIVDILVISKLQSDSDRSDLDEAKHLITSRKEFIITSMPLIIGGCSIINMDRWTIISLENLPKRSIGDLCDNISEAVDRITVGKHFILDLSQIKIIDTKLAAYLMGLRRMLSQRDKQMSIAWLPNLAVSDISETTQNALINRFSLYKKGSFLLSSDSSIAI